MKLRYYCLPLILFISVVSAQANIDSQWRGPYRTGHYPNEKLLKQWPSEGPKLLWAFNKIGEGYSSPAVTDKNVYVAGMIDEQGYLFKFDLKGNLVWKLNFLNYQKMARNGVSLTQVPVQLPQLLMIKYI